MIVPALLLGGVGPDAVSDNPRDITPETIAVTNRQGPVEVTIIAEPGVVHLDRDLLLTIRVRAPEDFNVRLPDIAGRMTGFVPAGEFQRPPIKTDGIQVQEYCFRMTPTVSDEYRLGPMAVAFSTATSDQPPVENWLITSPVKFKRVPMAVPGVGDIHEPRRVMPSIGMLARRVAVLLLAALGIWIIARVIRRLRHGRRIRRMSPRRRALYELEKLLTSKLREEGRQKEFFAELALIVRRYIERAHAIRAPELTTEEFLNTVMADARFSRPVLDKLSEFLQSADLVKFAAWRPAPPVADRAVRTARDYIEADGLEPQAAP